MIDQLYQLFRASYFRSFSSLPVQQIMSDFRQNNSFQLRNLGFTSNPNGKNLIILNTQEGEKLLNNSIILNDKIGQLFKKQLTNTTCAVASISFAFNSLYQKSKISEDWVCQNIDIPKTIYTEGLTLQQAHILAQQILQKLEISQNYNVQMIHTNEMNEESFSNIIQENLNQQLPVICNYKMSLLGQTGLSGHFTPIGAYNKIERKFLLLDVWPETPLAWVESKELYEASNSLDLSSNESRGILIFKRNE